MGVPRFFKWLSERYPCVIAPVTDATIPTVHNLYLDMNGIIHNCTQTNITLRHKIADKELVLRIFQYIDNLFSLIQPTQYFFMAIDGVAPRAKMNQQRQRRYRSALEAEKAKQTMQNNGERVPDESELFDGNAISPGTEFMATLSQHLQYLIQKKMETDLKWRRCKIILSGHEVPGEGEHKIMEFVRGRKSQPNYNPNEVHCLYGLDADLIMLGLAAHEPHFLLLREDVFSQTFGRDKEAKEANKALVQKFHLVHLCALREYFMLEFEGLKEKLKFEFDLERIIDDFVLMCFLCGNDFLPHMPTLDIKEGAITTLMDLYKLILPRIEGYITEKGEIHFDRLQHLVSLFGEHEDRILSNRFAQQKKGKRSKRRSRKPAAKEILDDGLFGDAEVSPIRSDAIDEVMSRQRSLSATELKQLIDKEENRLQTDGTGAENIDSILGYTNVLDFPEPISGQYGIDNPLIPLASLEEDEEEEEDAENAVDILMEAETDEGNFNFEIWRKNYYQKKMNIDIEDPESMQKIVQAYVEALAWIYNYYYNRCVSWKWYFPYHYSPIASDLVGMADAFSKIDFVLGEPFHPFEQLLGVLPPRSSKLVPEPYRELMLNPNSVISDFYPDSFDIDREGTKYEYEGVALLPFIDENRLLQAMATIDQSKLTEAEAKRNSFGDNLIFSYDPALKYDFVSTLPGELPDIKNSRVKVEKYVIPQPKDRFVPALCKGVKSGAQGLECFPTLFSREIAAEPRTIGVCLYQQPSKAPTIVLHLDVERFKKIHRSFDEEINQTPVDDDRKKEYAENYLNLLGQQVYIGYPYPRIAYISSLSDEFGSYYEEDRNEKRTHTPKESEGFRREVGFHRNVLLRKFGMDVGEVDVLLFVKLFKGMEKTKKGSTVKLFHDQEFAYPAQLLVTNYKPTPDPKFEERGPSQIQQDYAVDSSIVYLGEDYYGSTGRVAGFEKNGPFPKIVAQLNSSDNKPDYPQEMKDYTSSKYYSLREAASKLGISPRLVGLLIGSIKVEMPDGKLAKNNIGLQLRSTKVGKRIVGYVRCEYSVQNLNDTYYLNYQTGVPMDKPSNSMFSTNSAFGWQISNKALDMMKDFIATFPDLIDILNSDDIHFTAENMFPDIKEKVKSEKLSLEDAKKLYGDRLNTISQWISGRGHLSLPFLPLETDTFTKDLITLIENSAIEYETAQANTSEKSTKVVVPHTSYVFKAGDPYPAHLIRTENYYIGHRVVSLASTGHVPFGMKGIIVGIEGENAQIVFDQEFIGGNLLHGRLVTRRGGICPVSSLLNLSFVPKAVRFMKIRQDQMPTSDASKRQPKQSDAKVAQQGTDTAKPQQQQPQQPQQPQQHQQQSKKNPPQKFSGTAPYQHHFFDSAQGNRAYKFAEKNTKGTARIEHVSQNLESLSSQASSLLENYAKKNLTMNEQMKSYDPASEFKKFRNEDRERSKYSNRGKSDESRPQRDGAPQQRQKSDNRRVNQQQFQQQTQPQQMPPASEQMFVPQMGYPPQQPFQPQFMQYPPQMGYPPQPYMVPYGFYTVDQQGLPVPIQQQQQQPQQLQQQQQPQQQQQQQPQQQRQQKSQQGPRRQKQYKKKANNGSD